MEPRGTTRSPAVLVVLAAALNGAFIVGIPAYTAAGFGAEALAMLLVAAGAGGGGFLEKEVEEFVADGQMGLLLELLEGCEAEESLQERKRGADVFEKWIRDCCGGSRGLGRGCWAGNVLAGWGW